VDVLDIIASLKLPKATAYRLVDWFVTQGYLSREPARRRLIIGPKLTNLAFGALSSSMRHDTPHVVLQRLVHTLNETCNIGTLLNGEVVYLDRVEADHWPLRLHYTAGSRVPLHCSAIGKLFWHSPHLHVAAAYCRAWNCDASPTAPLQTVRDSRPSCRQHPQGAGVIRSRGISRPVSSAWRCR
jgi:DNA-binding IclR family transcriptional regulator